MASWSGLYDDIHGVAYAPLGNPIPVSRELFREVQKKGNYAITQNIEDSAGNPMAVPTSRLKVSTTGNDLGGSRIIAADNSVAAITDAQAVAVFSTKQTINVVGDSSLNGGGAY